MAFSILCPFLVHLSRIPLQQEAGVSHEELGASGHERGLFGEHRRVSRKMTVISGAVDALQKLKRSMPDGDGQEERCDACGRYTSNGGVHGVTRVVAVDPVACLKITYKEIQIIRNYDPFSKSRSALVVVWRYSWFFGAPPVVGTHILCDLPKETHSGRERLNMLLHLIPDNHRWHGSKTDIYNRYGMHA